MGIRCDGSDEAARLTSALQGLPDGATFQIPCRAGIGAAGVLIHNKNNVVIEGISGGGFQGLANTPSKVLFRAEVCNGCTIRGLVINANNVGAAGISVFYSNNTTVENNTVENVAYPAWAGIIGMSNRNNRYTGNTVGYTHGLYSGSTVVDAPRGMWIGNPSSNLIDWNPTITHNWVHDVDATGFALHTVGVNFTGNTADDTKGAGVKLTPPPGSGQQSVISDNRFRRNLFHGVQISGADAPVIIQNNLLEGNGNGIYVAEGGFNNSQVINNTITGSRYAGIYLYNGNGVVIQNNRIQSSAQTGIGLEAISGRSIANVQISGNGVSGTNGDAIALLGRGGSISSVAISANSISDSARYGILIEPNGISGASLTGNCFSNNRVGTLLDQRGALIAPLTSALCSLLGGLPSQSSSSQPPQTTPPVVVQPPSQPAFTPIRINAGGQQYVDPSGTVWATDFGYAQGKFDFVSTPIQNTNASPLYQTARWWDRVLDYNFQVPAGRTYTVTLKFAETYFSGPNQRLQDIYANGQLVLGSFDILAQAGGMYRAVDRTFQVTAPNGSIALKFVGRVDDPFVSGVEIK